MGAGVGAKEYDSDKSMGLFQHVPSTENENISAAKHQDVDGVLCVTTYIFYLCKHMIKNVLAL